jgi:hypothetical protein
MPLYEITGPDGKVYEIEGPPNATKKQIVEAVQAKLAAAAEEKPKEGVGAAFRGGLEGLLSRFQTAGEAVFLSPEEAARRGVERSEEIGQRFAPGSSLDAVKQAYAERGLLGGAGEVISQIPGAFAEQIPNIAATLASAKAGALAGSFLAYQAVLLSVVVLVRLHRL